MFEKIFGKSKSNKRRKVRRIGNFSAHVEMYIYILMGIIVAVGVIISLLGR